MVVSAAGRSPNAALAAAISSPADAYRSAGALAIPRATTASISGGKSLRRSVTRGGGSEMCAYRTAASFWRTKGTYPVRAS
jgi:hypothetical protein